MTDEQVCVFCKWYGRRCRNKDSAYYGTPIYPFDTCPYYKPDAITRAKEARKKYYTKEWKNLKEKQKKRLDGLME